MSDLGLAQDEQDVVGAEIAVLHHGQLLACDVPEKVMKDETVQAAYLGEPL